MPRAKSVGGQAGAQSRARSSSPKRASSKAAKAAPASLVASQCVLSEEMLMYLEMKKSPFESFLNTYINTPLLRLVPTWVSPNSITYVNTLVCWAAVIIGYEALRLESIDRHMAMVQWLIVCSLVFVSLVLDCLDGMQARRLGRSSKFGEYLDHGLDSVNIPLITGCLLIVLDPSPLVNVLSMFCVTLTYNAQLVLYRQTGRMIPPVVGGNDGQIGVCVGVIVFGFASMLYGRLNDNLQLGVFIFSWFALSIQFINCVFFFKHLHFSFARSLLWTHMRFLLSSGGFSAVYMAGRGGVYGGGGPSLSFGAFIVGLSLVSLEGTGTYLLRTVIYHHNHKQPNARYDPDDPVTGDRFPYIVLLFNIALYALREELKGETVGLSRESFTAHPKYAGVLLAYFVYLGGNFAWQGIMHVGTLLQIDRENLAAKRAKAAKEAKEAKEGKPAAGKVSTKAAAGKVSGKAHVFAR